MVEIFQIVDRLADIQRKIEGIQNAYHHNEVPNSLREGMLPAFITVPGAVEYQSVMGHNVAEEPREYIMSLFLAPVALPSDVALRMQIAVPFFHRVFLKFKPLVNADGLIPNGALIIQGDGGLEPIEYAGSLFAGIQFRVQVIQYLE